MIDDFAPKGTGNDVNRLHQTADRLLRAQGNRGGRNRMNPDGTLKETFWPRGIILSTGEDVPKGHSLRARMFISHVKKGDITKSKLTALQRHAAEGRFAEAMAGYVSWLARRADGLSDGLAKRATALRAEVAGDHTRTPDNIASLLIGIEQFLLLAENEGAITRVELKAFRDRAARALSDAAEVQDVEQEAEKPAETFRHMIGDALASGRGHLADRDGNAPSGREVACGWRERTITRNNGDIDRDWWPTGDRIGWIEGDQLWLIPAAAYACAEKLSKDQNRSLGITERMLGSRLEEAGWLLSKEEGKLAKKVRVGGVATRAYHISVAQFLPDMPLPPRNLKRWNWPAWGQRRMTARRKAGSGTGRRSGNSTAVIAGLDPDLAAASVSHVEPCRPR